MPIWDPANETAERSDMQQLQLERLQATVNRAYRNVRFYHREFDALGIMPEDVQSLADISKLPFTAEEDLRVGYPYDMIAVPLREIVRIEPTSPSPHKPIAIAYTRKDIDERADMIARTMSAAGVTQDDVVQIATEHAVGGSFGTYYGVERLGASVIPPGPGGAEGQIRIMQDFRSTVLVSTPSYARYLIELMRQSKITSDALSLRIGLFGSEPMSRLTRLEIESYLGILAAANYGVNAVTCPGIAGECEIRAGLHVQEDHFMVEVIDPDTSKPAGDGTPGELVITTLTQEGLPIIRYRTGDLVTLDLEPCRCGRRTARISGVLGRVDGAALVRGVLVRPGEIEGVLYGIEHVEPHYQVVIDRQNGLDVLTLRVELSSAMMFDQIRLLQKLEHQVQQEVQAAIGVPVRASFVEPQTFRGLTDRVLDQRDT